MANIHFQIPMTPISLNNTGSFGKKRFFKNKKTMTFERDFNMYLSQLGRLRKHINDHYNQYIHAIKIESYFYINEKKFFAQPKNMRVDKTISKKSLDIDNTPKKVNDLIFRWLGIDDSQIVNTVNWKIPTNDLGTMVFVISLVKFPALFEVPHQSLSSVLPNTLTEPDPRS